VAKLVDVPRGRGTRAGAACVAELVDDLEALRVRLEHPLVVDATVRDEQRAPVGLLERRERRELGALRFVDETLAAPVDEHAVLGVIEGRGGDQGRVRHRHAGRHQVAVEACALAREARAGGLTAPQPGAVADRPGAQRDRGRVRVDERRQQRGARREAARSEQRVGGAQLPHPVHGAHGRAHHGPGVHEQRDRFGAHQQLTVGVADGALGGREPPGHVELVGAAEAEKVDGRAACDAKVVHERERVAEAVDQPLGERRVAPRVDTPQGGEVRRGPEELRVSRGAARLVRALDDDRPAASAGARGRRAQPGHAGAEHEQVGGPAHVLVGSLTAPE
jgi:hypothetical protein